MLFIEVLSVEFIGAQSTVLGIITNFVKLKIVNQFDDMFLIPFKSTPQAKFCGITLTTDKFLKQKIILTKEDNQRITEEIIAECKRREESNEQADFDAIKERMKELFAPKEEKKPASVRSTESKG